MPPKSEPDIAEAAAADVDAAPAAVPAAPASKRGRKIKDASPAAAPAAAAPKRGRKAKEVSQAAPAAAEPAAAAPKRVGRRAGKAKTDEENQVKLPDVKSSKVPIYLRQKEAPSAAAATTVAAASSTKASPTHNTQTSFR